MLRFISLFMLFTLLLFAQEQYPQTFSQLATPLYKAKKHFTQLKNFPLLQQPIINYEKRVDTLLADGLKVDAKQDREEKLAYLRTLRDLQKEYDYLIFLLHKRIVEAIEEDDYDAFIRLTAYPFEGLLQNQGIKKRATAYYKNNKAKCKCTLLEKTLQNDKLLEETAEFFEAEMRKSSYNSESKQNIKKKVYIKTARHKNRISIYFVNTNLYPITIRVKPLYKSIHTQGVVKNEFVIPAKGKIHYADLIIEGANSYYRYNYNWIMGSKDAKHKSDYIYRLPYEKGDAHKVSQGYNGSKTHRGRSAYSIDFPMPIGTAIYAARDGLVVKTKADSNVGGYEKRFASSGNYVRILHDDGTFSIYYHLKQNGVLVHVGQKVSRGEKIGYSGNTGYTSGPHLHFSVFKAKNARETQTIPVQILSKEGIIKDPEIGKFYTAK